MSLARVFLKHLEHDTEPRLTKIFSGKLEVKKNNLTLGLVVHVFDSAEYTLEELQALQNAWSTFVPMDHIGFSAAPLVVSGTKLHAGIIEGSWSAGEAG